MTIVWQCERFIHIHTQCARQQRVTKYHNRHLDSLCENLYNGKGLKKHTDLHETASLLNKFVYGGFALDCRALFHVHIWVIFLAIFIRADIKLTVHGFWTPHHTLASMQNYISNLILSMWALLPILPESSTPW